MSPNAIEQYEFLDFRLDVSERLLLRNGTSLPLSEKVFETLCFLVRRSGGLVSKDELLAQIWPDTIVEENSLDKSISRLRQVLGERKGTSNVFPLLINIHPFYDVIRDDPRFSQLVEMIGCPSYEEAIPGTVH